LNRNPRGADQSFENSYEINSSLTGLTHPTHPANNYNRLLANNNNSSNNVYQINIPGIFKSCEVNNNNNNTIVNKNLGKISKSQCEQQQQQHHDQNLLNPNDIPLIVRRTLLQMHDEITYSKSDTNIKNIYRSSNHLLNKPTNQQQTKSSNKLNKQQSEQSNLNDSKISTTLPNSEGNNNSVKPSKKSFQKSSSLKTDKSASQAVMITNDTTNYYNTNTQTSPVTPTATTSPTSNNNNSKLTRGFDLYNELTNIKVKIMHSISKSHTNVSQTVVKKQRSPSVTINLDSLTFDINDNNDNDNENDTANTDTNLIIKPKKED
jgi:hypothetical protein